MGGLPGAGRGDTPAATCSNLCRKGGVRCGVKGNRGADTHRTDTASKIAPRDWVAVEPEPERPRIEPTPRIQRDRPTPRIQSVLSPFTAVVTCPVL